MWMLLWSVTWVARSLPSTTRTQPASRRSRTARRKGRDGVIVFTTQGTGIGSAIIVNGTLLTNTELGHLEIDGTDAEKNASSGQKTLQGLNWEQWAQRLQRYYSHVEFLLNPDLFVVGGGVSENHEKFMPLLKLKTPMIPAKLLNTAGIVGAAYYAAQNS